MSAVYQESHLSSRESVLSEAQSQHSDDKPSVKHRLCVSWPCLYVADGSSVENPDPVNCNVERGDADRRKDAHEGGKTVTMFRHDDEVARLLGT